MRVYLRFLSVLTVSALILTGCTSNSYQAFLKPGASVDRVNRDRAECDVEANQLFPAANWPNTYPTATVGYWGGGWGGGIGIVHTSDVNSGMRNQHRNQCMRIKGYEPNTFPRCTSEQLASGSFAPITRSPQPSPSICAVTLEGGGWTLIDLSKPL
ncbi:hypothetical protein [uncultured Shimia sp.]|uniref:hypothetical protein n=1 Tax=uncultured Shimia sp. TaxID=573152 RepID=UPI00260200DB|nr:hypothetical protein [uncultured Shimia sp.]